MSKKYGIPYMGSKNGVLSLIEYCLTRHYTAEYFIDPFCGGFSISHYVLENTNMKVLANDIDESVIALYEELLFNGGNEFNKLCYNWVSRDDFFKIIKNENNEFPKWYVGYVNIIYSFGNKGKSYLYGNDIENGKHALHEYLVNNDKALLEKQEPLKHFVVSEKVAKMNYRESPRKRLLFMSEFKNWVDKRVCIEHLERLENLERLQNLERLENLERLQNLERLENLDYMEFINSISDDVLSKAVVYCDPPYENTAKYSKQSIDYNEFWTWFRNSPFPIYVSSYQAPSDIEPINFENKRVLLSATSNSKVKQENIYWNGKGEVNETLFDKLFN